MRASFWDLDGFAKKLYSIATEEEFQGLQSELMIHPYRGVLIPGLGGARKIRMSLGNGGKRGGARVVYYFRIESQIWFLDIYPKSEKAVLSPVDKKKIVMAVEMVKAKYENS